MIVDYLFQDIISAPLADEYNAEVQSLQRRRQVGQGLATTARRAVRNSISFTNNAFSIVPHETASHRQGKEATAIKRSTLYRMSSSLKDQFTVADASSRHVPPSVVQSYTSTSNVLKGAFSGDYENGDSVSDYGRWTNDGRVRSNSNSAHDSAERGELECVDTSSFESFYVLLLEQCKLLDGPAKVEFEKRWGLDADSEHLVQDLVPSGVTAKLRLLFCCESQSQSRTTSRKEIFRMAIEETVEFCDAKIRELKICTDIQVGLEVMHLFIIDLLG